MNAWRGWMAGLFILAALPAAAEELRLEPKKYLEELQLKLDHAAQRANQPTATGSNVVGLRGSRQEPASRKLYWKGKPAAPSLTPDEVRLFRTAVERAQEGQADEAVTLLKSFQEKYPNSSLQADARETLRVLGAAKDPAPAASPVP